MLSILLAVGLDGTYAHLIPKLFQINNGLMLTRNLS